MYKGAYQAINQLFLSHDANNGHNGLIVNRIWEILV
jgi:hypothetical protein